MKMFLLFAITFITLCHREATRPPSPEPRVHLRPSMLTPIVPLREDSLEWRGEETEAKPLVITI
jgi:hypothetical protein